MLGNCAVISAVLLIIAVMLVAEQLAFLRGSALLIITEYAWPLVTALAVLYLNLFTLIYLVARRLLLKDTGRKLAHLEKQLRTRDTVVRDLSERLAREE